MNKKNIFLVCYGGGHINIIEPIVDRLILNENYSIKLLALTTAYEKVKNKYDKSILKKVSDYLFLFENQIEDIMSFGLEIFNDNYNKSSKLSKLEILSYIGLSFFELINKYGYDEAIKKYKEKGRQVFLPIETIESILKFENVDLLITTNSPRFEKASLIASKNLGIKNIQILDLFDRNISKNYADYTIVMNDIIRNKLINKGFKKEKILSIGQPALEESVNKILKINRDNLINDFSNDKTKKNLIYFSQPPIRFDKYGNSLGLIDYIEINSKIFFILESLKNKYNIFFRIHPNENYSDYKDFFEKYKTIKYLNNDLSLQETISLSDIIITPYSTVAVEAKICKKIVFTFKPDFSDSYPINELKEKSFIYSNSFSELLDNLKKFKLDLNSLDLEYLNKNFINNFTKLVNEYLH